MNRIPCGPVQTGVIRILAVIGVALLAASCSHSSAPPPPKPKLAAKLELEYTPGYSLFRDLPPPAETRHLTCDLPLTPLCAAAVHVARHGAGDRTCVGTGSQPADIEVSGIVYGRERDTDLRGCWAGFPPRMQRAVNTLFAAFGGRGLIRPSSG